MAAATGTLKAAIDCSSCGREIGRDETYALTSDRRPVCNDCMATASTLAQPDDPLAALIASHPPTVVRTYSGLDEAAAAWALDGERRRLAVAGYRVQAQTWSPTERPIIAGVAGVIVLLFGLWLMFLVEGGFLVGLLTSLVGVAILAVYAGAIRPSRLTATFEAGPAAAASGEPATPVGRPSADRPATDRPAADRLRELQALHDEGLISDVELAARRAAIIDSI